MAATVTTTTAVPSINGVHKTRFIPRGTVSAELSFYAPPADGSIPFNFVEKQPEGQPQNNYGEDNHDVDIEDVRGKEKNYNLDKDAFQLLSGVSSEETSFSDDEHIKKVYYPEVEKVILDNIPGTYRVLIFDHTIRRAGVHPHRQPVRKAHVDQTGYSSKLRVKFHLPDEADELLKGRYRIINVWRSIGGPIESDPLAFASAATVRDEDLVGIEHRYPTRTGETAAVRYKKDQRWHYWSGMDNDERVFLQCFDSANPTARVPHTSFEDSRVAADAKPRQSIEVRTLVFG